MIDIGFSKLFIVGGIALIVIGPERLPGVARTLGALIGRAQRYVSEVKAEVNRSMELESLAKMKQEFESAAREVDSAVQGAAHQASDALDRGFDHGADTDLTGDSHLAWTPEVGPVYERPKKNWRIKRGNVPHWFKQREGVRRHVQSGAARVARFRPNSAPIPARRHP